MDGALFDPVALGIVLLGTLVATLARSGWRDMTLAIRSALTLAGNGFDEEANRAAFARWARAIRLRGVLGAEERLPPDKDLARGLTALVRTGSIKALRGAHDDACARHLRERGRVVRVFEQAGELAPVFGLVGTLFSLTQLAPGVGTEAAGSASAVTLAAIATAVLSSIYGVLAAHFLFLPLAHAVARRAQTEEEQREALVEWLAHEIEDAMPGQSPSRVARLAPIA